MARLHHADGRPGILAAVAGVNPLAEFSVLDQVRAEGQHRIRAQIDQLLGGKV